MTGELTVTVNGEQRALPAGATVSDVVRSLGRDPGGPGVAVAVNGTVVPRGGWEERPVEGGDDIEVVAAVQGGS